MSKGSFKWAAIGPPAKLHSNVVSLAVAGLRRASDCAAVQSDPHLCCKHPGEFVIFFSCFYSLLLIVNKL